MGYYLASWGLIQVPCVTDKETEAPNTNALFRGHTDDLHGRASKPIKQSPPSHCPSRAFSPFIPCYCFKDKYKINNSNNTWSRHKVMFFSKRSKDSQDLWNQKISCKGQRSDLERYRRTWGDACSPPGGVKSSPGPHCLSEPRCRRLEHRVYFSLTLHFFMGQLGVHSTLSLLWDPG